MKYLLVNLTDSTTELFDDFFLVLKFWSLFMRDNKQCAIYEIDKFGYLHKIDHQEKVM